MPGPPQTFPLYDRLMDGGLTAFLTAARSEGLTHEVIAARLASEHDVNVSAETVRRWCRELDLPARSSDPSTEGARS